MSRYYDEYDDDYSGYQDKPRRNSNKKKKSNKTAYDEKERRREKIKNKKKNKMKQFDDWDYGEDELYYDPKREV